VVDLAVTISDNPDPLSVGDTLTYTIVVTNNGPDGATGTSLSQNLPPGVTFGSASPDQGSCGQAAGVVSCNLGALAVGQSTTITVTVIPTTPGTITSTVSVSSNEADSNLSNNADATVTLVLGPTATPTSNATPTPTPTATPDASCKPLLRKVHAGTANPGGVLTYTLLWSNPCDTLLTDVVVTDVLPPHTRLISAESDAASVSAAQVVPTDAESNSGAPLRTAVTLSAATLAKGPAATAKITVQIDPTVPPDAVLLNRATLTTAEFPDVFEVRDTVRVRATVDGNGKLSCGFNAQQLTGPGRMITYVARYQNGSASNALTLTLPVNDLEVLKIYPTPAAAAGGVFTWGNLATTSGLVKVTARISPLALHEAHLPASATIDDGLGQTAVCETESVVDRGDKLFIKLRGQAKSSPGRYVTYVIQYRSAVGDNEMMLSLPPGVNVLSVIPPAASQNGALLTWRNLPLPAGPVKVKTQISATVSPHSVLLANATMSDSTGTVVRASTETQIGVSPPTSTGSTPAPSGSASLEVGLNGPGQVVPGSKLTYTVSLNVLGNGVVDGLTLHNVLPASFSYLLAIPAPTSVAGGTLSWNFGSLQGPDTLKVKVSVVVAASARASATTSAQATDAQGHSVSATLPVSIR
jgi:uncharacterized repeat protein (TIGR01451 family)